MNIHLWEWEVDSLKRKLLVYLFVNFVIEVPVILICHPATYKKQYSAIAELF